MQTLNVYTIIIYENNICGNVTYAVDVIKNMYALHLWIMDVNWLVMW